MSLLHRELTVILTSYMLAGIPVAGILLAGRMTPLYRVPFRLVCRWWSWAALALVLVAFVLAAA
jgi:hypothetical protein